MGPAKGPSTLANLATGIPPQHHVSMGEFVRFVGTAGEPRYKLVTGMAEPYSPVKDPYARIRRAIKTGRRTAADHTVLNQALAQCRPDMRSHYAEITKGWLRYLDERDFTGMVDVATGRWQTADLAVRVTPDLAVEYPDGTVDAIKLYLLVEPIPAGTAELMLWLMHQTMSQTCPGAKAVVLDVRRRRPYTVLPTRPGYRTWLEAEARSLAYLHAHAA
jgi:hypothetical protein